jgi:3'(2'), 5'-bisphosphate nucleotidase
MLDEQAPIGDLLLSEEAPGARDAASLQRLSAARVWIVDPLDGTHEYGNAARGDWAVHVALVIDHQPAASAVVLPAQKLLLTAEPPPAPLPPAPARPRIVVSRSRRPPWVDDLARHLGGVVTQMGSAGAKAMSIVLGAHDIYVHDAGQYEWDSAAPIGVARAAGLHTSRLDGSPLTYNNPDPRMPDLLICRPELADAILAVVSSLARGTG